VQHQGHAAPIDGGSLAEAAKVLQPRLDPGRLPGLVLDASPSTTWQLDLLGRHLVEEALLIE
jgi:hypothetical protein